MDGINGKDDLFLWILLSCMLKGAMEKRSSFYSDFTFGCWINKDFKELVPVGKAYSGYTNEELKKLDLWIRNNTLQRFGPVRSVKIGLIVEISFDNINFSSRHKSGVALRFPRFSKIRWDKHSSEVCTLKRCEGFD